MEENSCHKMRKVLRSFFSISSLANYFPFDFFFFLPLLSFFSFFYRFPFLVPVSLSLSLSLTVPFSFSFLSFLFQLPLLLCPPPPVSISYIFNDGAQNTLTESPAEGLDAPSKKKWCPGYGTKLDQLVRLQFWRSEDCVVLSFIVITL